jgi:hypothetical protein
MLWPETRCRREKRLAHSARMEARVLVIAEYLLSKWEESGGGGGGGGDLWLCG